MNISSFFSSSSNSETSSATEVKGRISNSTESPDSLSSKVVDFSYAKPYSTCFSQAQYEKFEKLNIDDFISKKYLAHLFGDSFLENSPHAGWFVGDGLIHMIRVLQENNISPEVGAVLSDFEECLQWQGRFMSVISLSSSDEGSSAKLGEECYNQLVDTIRSLEVNQKTLFPGGYKGHSVLYEIKKCGDDDFSFTVYNAGDGIKKHWMMVEKDGIHKVQAAYTLNKIKLESFFENEFLERLLLMKLESVDDFAYELYDELLPLLGGERKACSSDIRDYMISQRSGTCVWKMLCVYLRYNIPLLQYKYLKLKARLDVFDKWHQLGHSLDFNRTNQRLLNRIVVNYERLIYKKESLPLEFSRKELLVLGLLKVQKTFNEYKFLLSESEIKRTEAWFTSFTGQSIYEDNGYVIRREFEKGDSHLNGSALLPLEEKSV